MAAAAANMSLGHTKDMRRGKDKRIQPKITASPRSKMLKLPEIPKPGGGLTTGGLGAAAAMAPGAAGSSSNALSAQDGDGDDAAKSAGPERNPFHMPSDVEVFAMREEDRRVKQQAKEAMKNLSIYDKNTVKRKNFKALLAEDADDIEFYNSLRKRDADKFLVNRQTRADRHFGKENLHDFIAKKREMFLVQYALGVKREEMRKLEEIAQAEEQKLLDDEKALEEDAAKFDAFLKENDKNSVEAIKKAEMETKAKLEKIQEIKKLNVQIMSIRSDMSKNEDQLKDLQRYRHFLEKLTPKEFLASQSATDIELQRVQKNAKRDGVAAAGIKTNKPDGSDSQTSDSGAQSGQSGTDGQPGSGGGEDGGAGDEEFWENDDEPVLFFKSPDQLLDIFAELEENNLALIQNCQETEETLEELKAKIAETSARMESETASLNQQIEFLNAAIAREEEKARMLEERAKMFTTGIVGAESQEKLLEDLNHKVKEVYRRCLGDNDGNLSTLQMLTSIENRLEQLFEFIELMPPEKVEQAEKVVILAELSGLHASTALVLRMQIKDKERRQRLREEKMEAQRALQEERVQRALERARAPVKKKTGKPVVFRSPPPQKKKKKEEDNKKKEEDDLEYFWSF
nr:Coiled-coil domain-containing protein 38 [Polyrhizophydium stewartii]